MKVFGTILAFACLSLAILYGVKKQLEFRQERIERKAKMMGMDIQIRK